MPQDARLYRTIAAGVGEAGQVLKMMAPIGVSISTPDLRPIRLEKIPSLLGAIDRTVVATYSRVTGDIYGHLAFLYDHDTAQRLVSAVTGEAAPGIEMGSSALCEVSNVAGSRILNCLSNATDLKIVPTPPILVSDMAGAILESVLHDLLPSGNEAMVLQTEIHVGDEDAVGFMLLIPRGDGLALLVSRLES